ncbi:MAG: enoyl-CoA hydratase [Tardiphaga sp.]|jgi:enoyl-CoA hydratase/carnithine racemase|nr:enoyl-CoA hydratase [Tardiphaga sp.]
MTDHIKTTTQDGILEIIFARPDKKNALSNAMYRKASDALEGAQTDSAIRVVLLSSEGDAFTSGNDLADFAGVAAGGREELQAARFIRVLANAEKPLIAAVPGLAVGVGTTMLLHCDLVFVADTAKLSAPFVNLALVPEAASSLLLTARIGHARAFALFAMGESLSGAEALTLGIANKMLPKDEVIPAARAAARALAEKPLGAVVATKKLMRESEAILARMAQEGKVFGERLKTAEAREVFSAFAERRPPNFTKLAS